VGVELIDIAPGSPAAAAGLRAEDIVVGLGGVPVERTEDLQRLLSGEAIDHPQSVTVLRAGDLIELTIRPVELTAA
jgi:S1-C subfamily serine protease